MAKEDVKVNEAQEENVSPIPATPEETAEAFGKPIEKNAFGISAIEEKKVGDKPEKEVKEKSVKDDKVKDKEKSKEDKPNEEKTVAEEKADVLLEQLKATSPEFAELCKKKGIKDTQQAIKLYIDQEKEFTKRSTLLNQRTKLVEPYVQFDSEGNAIGYTEAGKKLFAGGGNQQNIPANNQEIKQAQNAGLISPEQAAQLQQINANFWEQFEKNPVETLAKIMLATAQFSNKGLKDEFGKNINGLSESIKPILEERENQKFLSMIDEVAQEQIKAGDEKAQDFIDEYAGEIEAELKKVSPEFKKANPKLAIEQAYLKVKNVKIQEWQNQLLKKQEEEQKNAQDAADTGGSSGGSEPADEPEIAGMKEHLKSRPGSVFFGG